MSALLYHGPTAAIRPIPAAAGIGLRRQHHTWVLEQQPPVAWFEVHAESCMTRGVARSELDAIGARYPLSLHCVGLSLGSTARPESTHLRWLQELVARYCPDLISDHLAWNAVDGVHLPDLLPLPYTEEALRVVIRNVLYVQEVLQRQVLLENPSRYVRLADSALTEAEFLAEVVLRTGCGVLLDLNNIYVSARNQRDDPQECLNSFLESLSAQSVREVHLAGHSIDAGPGPRELLLDDHGSCVCPEVWALYATALRTLGPVPTLVEWDKRIPAFGVIEEQASIAQALMFEANARSLIDVVAA